MHYITKLYNKAVPLVERFVKWVMRTVFELLKLTGLAFMVINLIAATVVVEATIAGIVVLAAIIVTKPSR